MTLHLPRKARANAARYAVSGGLLAAGGALGIIHSAARPGVFDGGTLAAFLLLAAAAAVAAATRGGAR